MDTNTVSAGIKVITVNVVVFDKRNYRYTSSLNTTYRVSIYEFVGDPERARFVEDLGVTSYSYAYAEKRAKLFSSDLGIPFVLGIEMGDSVDKVYKSVLKL